MKQKHILKTKRVYESAQTEDGFRVFVERLWPRGLTKQKAAIDLWMKDVAPSPELRKWYSHDRAKWSEFKRKYLSEIDRNKDFVEELRKHLSKENVTLLYASKEEVYNSAAILRDVLAAAEN